MNPYGAYADPYAYANPYGDASGAGGGGYGGNPYAGGGGGQGWWAMPGYDMSHGAAAGSEGDWGGAWGGKDNGKGAGKGAARGGGKGGGKPSGRYDDWGYSQGDNRYGSVEDEDPDMGEIRAAFAQVQGERDTDARHMEILRKAEEEEARTDRAALLRERADSSGGSDSGDALPPPASEAEIEEARLIVQKAQREAVEREKMKAKAKTASRDDLQAMINARLALK